MPTSYSALIDSFLSKVEKDREYFNYFNLTETQAMELAKQRAKMYLDEAAGRIMLECQPSVDFSNKDDALEIFNFNLNAQEKFLIPCLMYEYYLFRHVAYIKSQTANYTPSELRVFDPSNARTTFMEIYNTVCQQNTKFLEAYNSKDRDTNEFVGIDYASENADN